MPLTNPKPEEKTLEEPKTGDVKVKVEPTSSDAEVKNEPKPADVTTSDSKPETTESTKKRKKSSNRWLDHVKKWKSEHPDLVKTMKVTDITKKARETYVPISKSKK